jgi:hypothetical protein
MVEDDHVLLFCEMYDVERERLFYRVREVGWNGDYVVFWMGMMGVVRFVGNYFIQLGIILLTNKVRCCHSGTCFQTGCQGSGLEARFPLC